MKITVAYLASYVLSVLGNAVAAIALPLVILQTTGSVLGAGTVAAATAIPSVLAGLFMGVLIDRINRRSSSIATDLISGASVAALPLIDLFTDLSIGLFVVFGVIGALGDIPGITARETLLPAIVARGALSAERIIGLRESLGAAALVVGPGAAGLLLALLDGTSVLWVTAGLSFAAAATTLLIPHRAGAVDTAGATPPRQSWGALKEGWSVLLRSPFLVVLLSMTFVAGIVTSSFQGLILPVYFTAMDQPELLGLVLSALAVGLLMGSGAYALLARPGRGRYMWMSTGLIGASAGLAVMGTLDSAPIVLAGAFVTGAGCGLFTSLAGVLMLERIPDHARGRVLSVQNAAVAVAPSLGIMTASVLTETVGLGIAAVVAAGIWGLMTVGVLLAKPIRTLGADAQNSVDDHVSA